MTRLIEVGLGNRVHLTHFRTALRSLVNHFVFVSTLIGCLRTANESRAQPPGWTLMTTAPSVRQYPGTAFDSARNRVVVFGGSFEGPVYSYYGDTWEWDGANWLLRTTGGPAAREGHGMVYDSARNRVVLFGGHNAGGYGSDTWEWDGNAWALMATTGPSARAYHAMTYDSTRGRVVLCGGYAAPNYYGDTWEWDGVSWTLRAMTGPTARNKTAMAFDVVRNRTVLFSGVGATLPRDTWEWDGTTWVQRSNTGPSGRYDHAMTYDAAHGVIVMHGGGYSGIPLSGTFDDVWTWNGTSWTKLTTPGPAFRQRFGMSYDTIQNRVLAFGGYFHSNGIGGFLRDLWYGDGTLWSPNPICPLSFFSMSFDSARGRTVLFGGDTNDFTDMGETWEWDGATWAKAATTGPAARNSHASVFDSVRGRTVIFGGQQFGGGGSLGDTWEWDGVNWTQMASSGPSLRHGIGMAFDSIRARTVLFGGTDNTNNFGDTWEWDGVNWMQVSSTGPSVRGWHDMTFDPIRGRTVLFGGLLNSNTRYGDTWEWDGSSWTQAASTGPIPRDSHRMAFDAVRGRIVLYGGMSANVGGFWTLQNDLWEWDGIRWVQRSPATLVARQGPGLAYDSLRGKMVLFGGDTKTVTGPSINQDETYEYTSRRLGDMDGDGDVDGHDLSLFVDAMLNNPSDPMNAYSADFDHSGAVDDPDVEPFIQALLAQNP